jgi:general secretion pathway protein H
LNEVFAPVSVRKSSGFTLLELLVALVLIGIILSFAVFTVDSGEDRRIREEANRFFYLLKLAQEEAILNASEWVLRLMSRVIRSAC